VLAVYLGPHTARNAVRTFSERALGRGPETMTPDDVPRLLEALRPMLCTLLGSVQGQGVLERIRSELP